MRGESPIAIESVRPVSSGALVWRRGGRLSLTIVVKATLTLVNDGVARLAAPADLIRAGGTGKGVGEPDLVPYKPRVDVTYTGFAWAPRPVQGLTVRMAVLGEGESVERAIQVVGDRVSQSAQPAPFVRMPIVYERAWSGPGEENPLGVSERSGRIANLFDPSGSKRAVGFASLPRNFPSRQRLLGGVDPRSLDTPAPDRDAENVWAVEVPAGLSFDYFQASPADQRLDHFSGAETLVLENLIEGQSRLHTRLPGIQGLAKVFGATMPPAGQSVDLIADTVAIDGAEKSVSITWRGTIPVAGTESLLRSLRVMTGIEYPGYPMQWPPPALSSTLELAPGGQRPKIPPSILDEPTPMLDGFSALSAGFDDEGSGSTKALSPEEAMKLLAGAKKALPFAGAAVPQPPPPERPDAGRLERTLSPDEVLALAHQLADLSPPPPSPVAKPTEPPPVQPPPPIASVAETLQPVPQRRLPIQGPPPPPAILLPSVALAAARASSAGSPPPPEPRSPSHPDVVVRVPGFRPEAIVDEDSFVGSTVAFTPEAAAELIARRAPPQVPQPTLQQAPQVSPPDPDDTAVDSSLGSTMAFSPEAAAELIARRMGTAVAPTPGLPPPPAPPPPAPPPPAPPPPQGPMLTRTNTVVMDAPSDVGDPPARKSR